MPPGRIERLSVAVVVDGVRLEDGTYQERVDEELEALHELVEAAVGFDVARGDEVTIKNLRFEEVPVFEPLEEHILNAVKPIFSATPEARAIYCTEAGNIIPAGCRFRQPGYASFLEALISEGPDLVYRGAVADRIVQTCSQGGLLTHEDLAAYEPIWRQPRQVTYRDAWIAMNDLRPPGVL